MCDAKLFCWCCDILGHDLNTWTDHAVETRDHVNFNYFFAFYVFVRKIFWISVLKSVRMPDICTGIFDGTTEIKFKTLMNRSPLNRPEVSTKIICLCARKQENRKFLLPKVNTLFI